LIIRIKIAIFQYDVYPDKRRDNPINRNNMDIEEIKNRVKKVTARVLEIDESEISDNANFSFDLGASSMKSILLVAAFQEEFNIEMDEEKSLEVQTISEAAEFISTYIGQ